MRTPWALILLLAASLAITVLAIVGLVTVVDSVLNRAEAATGSLAFDYRNTPDWEAWVDFEAVVVSPRAQAAADSLEAHGVEVYYWVQPFVCTWRGELVRGWSWDNKLVALVEAYGAVLEDSTGQPATVSGSDIAGCYVLDFRVPGFPEALAELVLDLDRPALQDYGCPGLRWEPSLAAVPASTWAPWEAGYQLYRELVATTCQCDAWGAGCSGLMLEKVAATLTPVPKAWRLLASRPAGAGQSMVRTDSQDPETRQTVAAVAMLQGAYMSWNHTQRAPEYFALPPTKFYRPAWARADGLVQRVGSWRNVIYNPTDTPIRYSRWTVQPAQGLVIQTRSIGAPGEPPRGRYTAWKLVK